MIENFNSGSSPKPKHIPRLIWVSYLFSILGGLGAYPAATLDPMVPLKSTSNLPPELAFPALLLFTFGGIIAAILAVVGIRKIEKHPEIYYGRSYAICGFILSGASYLLPLLIKIFF